ncbi:MAG: hypothetical protein Q3M30_11225 [Candidatus Electrothrix sp. Rat3]|nr:hypothetical protein [Candidatus Electrothrix rattekaaiensis]
MNATTRRNIATNALFTLILISTLSVTQTIFFPPSAHAALYWYADVRDKEISLCFAGDTVTSRPDRARQIVDYLQHFEWAANINFLTLDGTTIREAASQTGDIQKLACPGGDNESYYDGDIRVALMGGTNVKVSPADDFVPGLGCTGKIGTASWSNSPSDLETHRSCQYNLKLGDDDLDMTVGRPGVPSGTPWLNHTLHEFGHALGLSHEHIRIDEDAQCVPTTAGGYHATSSGYITPYDKNSIMHYRYWPEDIPECTNFIGTNYSNNGLTSYDKLALRIMYPEDIRVAKFIGKTIVKSDEPVVLRSALTQQGATSFAINNFLWQVDGNTESTTDTLNITFSTPGTHTFQFSYQDFLDRTYNYNGTIKVLDPTDFNNQISAIQSALLTMMTSSLPEKKTSLAGILLLLLH